MESRSLPRLDDPLGWYRFTIRVQSVFGTTDTTFTDSVYVSRRVLCCVSRRGNVNGDAQDACNMTDLTYLTAYLFGGGPEPPCWDEADIDATGAIGINDITWLVSYLYQGGPSPKLCTE